MASADAQSPSFSGTLLSAAQSNQTFAHLETERLPAPSAVRLSPPVAYAPSVTSSAPSTPAPAIDIRDEAAASAPLRRLAQRQDAAASSVGRTRQAEVQRGAPAAEAAPSATVISTLDEAEETTLVGGDGAEDEILFEADEVVRESAESPVIASGNVRAFFGDRYLTADRLEYFPDTDIVIAAGNVAITDENNETVFANRVELTGDLRDGVAENFSALLEENARLAADNAVREQGARTRLSRAVYTACNVCNKEGEPKVPTWRIKALRVTRDEERRVVRFRHAFFELKGVPIFYAPYIQGPDPKVERQSGFLTPLIGASSRLGFNFELPYYLALSNHTDATFFPKYTSEDGVLWQAEVRRRGNKGFHVFSGGIIDFDNSEPDENGNLPVDIPGVRWNIFARGHRDFGDNWRLGYDVERTSDDTFLRRYNVRRRGDLRKELDTSNTNRLRSNLYANFTQGGTRLSVNSYLFQGLRSTDVSELTPFVLPAIDVRHRFNNKILGGDTTLNGNFVSLQRTSGADTRRLTLSGRWEREHITRGGHRFKAFAELRGDAFLYEDLDEGTELTRLQSGDPGFDPLNPNAAGPAFVGGDLDPRQFETRFAPTAALEWSYPLGKRTKNARYFIEPRVQLVASPADRNPDTIINEDSQSIEFDYVGLFDVNKSTGFDRFEDGQRLNAGIAASAVFDNGITVEGSIGQQFRLQGTDAFSTTTGLGEERSDIVGELNVRYKNLVGIENRFRIDDDSGDIQRAESQAYFNYWRLNGRVNYVRLVEDPTVALDRREELTGNLFVRLTDHWRAGLGWRQDLQPDEPGDGNISQDYILAYQDECMSLDFTYRRDFTTDIGLEANDSFLVRFTLRSLVD
ncbi:MAG: LPS assembly protein LptD [Pseudomonadota bacterium]